ncbi:MAG TPA: DNA gyrase inhibitor YacG [Blastocatellia bacterium]
MRSVPMKCPTCGKPAAWKDNPDRPFCSERCKLIDLANWSSEEYHISGPAPGAGEESGPKADEA